MEGMESMRRVSLHQNVMYEFVDTDGQRFGALSNNFDGKKGVDPLG